MDIIYRKAWVENLSKFNRFKYREDKANIRLIFKGNAGLFNNNFNRILVIGFNYLQ